MLIAFIATLAALFAGPAAVLILALRAPVGRESEAGFEPVRRRSAMLPSR